MSHPKKQKIDSLLQSVRERADSRREERSDKPTISWDSFTPQSQEVLEYFGLEAPHTLNEYCCRVEDALVETIDHLKEARKEIKELRILIDTTNS